MRVTDFILLINDNMSLFLFLWFSSFAFYRLLFLRTVKSFFDPIFFSIIFTNSICTANVIFLSVLGEISSYYTFAYLLSEFALIFGIFLFSRSQPHIEANIPNRFFVQRLSFGMLLTILIFLICTLIVYYNRGIPLLMDSRAEASDGGSGFGFVTRLLQVANFMFVLFFFAKSKVTGRSNSKAEHFMFLLSVIFNLLSGFKAFFLLYLYGYFITHGQSKVSFWKRDIYVILAGTITILGLFAVVFDTIELEVILLAFMFRIVSSGDVYFLAFPNNIIEQLPSQDFFFQMFGSLLASFRLIGWDQAPLNYGYAINEIVNKNDYMLGPTFRYNVLWLVLTNSIVITVFLSFLIGLIVGGLRNALYKRTRIGVKFIFMAFLYNYSFILILGPEHGLNSIIIALPIFLLICFIVFLPVRISDHRDR
jgi:hypothetical protein